MSLKATKDRIICTQDPPLQFQNGLWIGNILPPAQGTVISVGPGDWLRTKRGKIKEQKRVPVEVKVGQRISWRPFSGSDLEHDNVTYRVIQPEDVLLLL